MNILDVEDEELPVREKVWASICSKQEQLLLKYKEIEGIPDWPFEFDSYDGQRWMKDFMWRLHEELCEALHALNDAYWVNRGSDEPNKELFGKHVAHFFEELSDALHFLANLVIVSEVNIEDDQLLWEWMEGWHTRYIDRIEIPWLDIMADPKGFSLETYERATSALPLVYSQSHKTAMSASYHLGLAGNTLKLKPWKQTMIHSDYGQFKSYLTEVAKKIFFMLWSFSFSPQDIFLLYARKNQVNQWRQKTKY